METNDAAVLIAGAGPTGLALALWLARFGVKVRIVDRNAGPAGYSRAFGGTVTRKRSVITLCQPGGSVPYTMHAANAWPSTYTMTPCNDGGTIEDITIQTTAITRCREIGGRGQTNHRLLSQRERARHACARAGTREGILSREDTPYAKRTTD
jgi:2-polyprenyl-6-methoxyphenol hydroxylase-like FAD-dependent oxidoreductase